MEEKVELPLSMQLLSGLIKTANAIIRRKDHRVRRWLGNIEEIRFPALSTPIFGVSTSDIPTGDHPATWVRIFTPECTSSSNCPVVIYYHGGGFAVLRPDFMLYDVFCRRLAKVANCIVISVNYPLAPENEYPSAHEESYKILTWLSSNAQYILPRFADVSKCFLAGDSAGGNIAHYVSCKAAKEKDSFMPLHIRGNILIQPFFGGKERAPSEISLRDGPIINLEMTDWYWKTYLPEGDDRDHPICNVFGPRCTEDISNIPFPPSLVIVGEYDLLKDWQVSYAKGLVNAGKSVKLLAYKKAVHVFHIFYRLDSSRQVLYDIAGFIKDNCCN